MYPPQPPQPPPPQQQQQQQSQYNPHHPTSMMSPPPPPPQPPSTSTHAPPIHHPHPPPQVSSSMDGGYPRDRSLSGSMMMTTTPTPTPPTQSYHPQQQQVPPTATTASTYQYGPHGGGYVDQHPMYQPQQQQPATTPLSAPSASSSSTAASSSFSSSPNTPAYSTPHVSASHHTYSGYSGQHQQQQQQQHDGTSAAGHYQPYYPDYEGNTAVLPSHPQQQQQQPPPSSSSYYNPNVYGLSSSMEQMSLHGQQQQQQQYHPQQQQQQQYGGVGVGVGVGAPVSVVGQQQQVPLQPLPQEVQLNLMHREQYPRPSSIESFARQETSQIDATPAFQRINQRQQADMSRAISSTRFMRATVQCAPNSTALLNKWVLPFGIVIQPFNDAPPAHHTHAHAHSGEGAGQQEDDIPVVNASKVGVQRCYKCRTYINPFVSWLDQGRRWQCNVCLKVNDVPNHYYSQLDEYGCRMDLQHRPELRCGTVEFIAPQEYMARPPQPPCYMFLIDVSYLSVHNGVVQSVARSIRDTLDRIPGDSRAKVGFVTFDTQVHFYGLKSTLSQPQMYVVGELQESLLPVPVDLFVTLNDSRHVIDALLDKLESNKLFGHTQEGEVCFGTALTAAGRIMGRLGGRIVAFLSTLPTLGPHALKNREDATAYGKAPAEKALLNESCKNYKDLALMYSRDQLSVDIFACTDQYVDLATLSNLPKYTGGETFYYPGFRAEADGEKLRHDLFRSVTRDTGLEAVMRVRASNGVAVSNFYGNFFIRGHDLLALPMTDADKSYGIELSLTDSTLNATNVSVQCAILYTATTGERRIRVHNLILPVTTSLAEMYNHADTDAIVSLMAKIAADEVPRKGLTETKTKIRDAVNNAMLNYRNHVSNNAMSAYLLVMPTTLQLLPLYASNLCKTDALLGGNEIRADHRIATLHRMTSDSVAKNMLTIHPALFVVPSTHEDFDALVDNVDLLPPLVPLTQRSLSDDNAFVLADGSNIYLWMGKNLADSNDLHPILTMVKKLNEPTPHNVFMNHLPFRKPPVQRTGGADDQSTSLDNNELPDNLEGIESVRARCFYVLVQNIRQRFGYATVRFVASPNMERLFMRKLLEDKVASGATGYDEFLQQLHKVLASVKK